MTYLLLIIIGIAVMFSFVFWVAKREAERHGTSASDEFVGICKSVVETASKKEARKQKALDMIQEKGELSNSEIRKALLVSSRSVVNYMDELEKEGKVEQIGKIGYNVTYRRK